MIGTLLFLIFVAALVVYGFAVMQSEPGPDSRPGGGPQDPPVPGDGLADEE
jgi:hypothetical protein